MKSIFAIFLLAGALSACTSRPAALDTTEKVILINTFEVQPGNEEQVLASWKKSREFLAAQPGFISTRLHHNIDAAGKYSFVNVAEWATAQDFQTATRKMRATLGDTLPPGTQYTPGLYTIIHR